MNSGAHLFLFSVHTLLQAWFVVSRLECDLSILGSQQKPDPAEAGPTLHVCAVQNSDLVFGW
jgi:hypothetical protein